MNSDKKKLMKHFSAVLRKRSLETKEVKESINPTILKSLTRKDLIQIVTDKFDGTIPKEFDLVEMENIELLKLIGDDMYIISYVTQIWSREQKEVVSEAKNVETKKGSEKTQVSTKKK